MRRVPLLAAVLLCSVWSHPSFARNYKPDFDCSVDHTNNSIATLLCENSEAAKHELMFDQTYYVLRQIYGKKGWKKLKQEAIEDDKIFQECIENNSETTAVVAPQADPTCYITHIDELTEKYKTRLSGAALEEANRDIDEHINIQQKLIDLGYLPLKTDDGVYGESTRIAIQKWQKDLNRPRHDGIVSDSDAQILLSDTKPITSNFPQKTRHESRSIWDTLDGLFSYINTSGWSLWIVIIVIISWYLLPTSIAINRKCRNILAVFVINVLFGWTLLGWVIALLMALIFEKRSDYNLRMQAMRKIADS